MKLLNRWKLLVGLACSSFLLSLGMMPVATEVSDPSVDVRTASLLSSPQPLIATHLNIEELRVGQRVLTGLASDELGETQVDSATWKKLTLTADWTWSDGTLDTFHIQTLQSPEWMQATEAQLGSRVPMPLDVKEMGCPDGLLAIVESIEPCPPLQDSPGRVILTTVSHLNAACRTLTVQDQAGHSDTIQTTDYHPFWSNTKQRWVKARALSIGDRLCGLTGNMLTLVESHRIAGIHTVFNINVEADHVYRVGQRAVLVHNLGCTKYHYTDAPASSFKDKIWAGTSGTDDPNLSPEEAVSALGLKRIPDKIIPIRDYGEFTKNHPFIVEPHPLGAGGGTDFIIESSLPGARAMEAIPLKSNLDGPKPLTQ